MTREELISLGLTKVISLTVPCSFEFVPISAFMALQVRNRDSATWKKAQYIFVKERLENEEIENLFNVWEGLGWNDQFLIIEKNKIFKIFDCKTTCIFSGNEDELKTFFLDVVKHKDFGKTITSSPTIPTSRQQIFYGAPGTGKSHKVKELTEDAEGEERVFRTTFHPDSDYSTFVGAYKPMMTSRDRYDIYQKKVTENGKVVQEETISYQFVPQAFLKAYVKAWKECAANVVEDETLQNAKVYLVIEEINRGNCAQIFGDLFQLLDRDARGFSDYAIHADCDLAKFIRDEFAETKFEVVDHKLKNQIASGKQLVLPPNLVILATMNTSDQSLFPIDSAFKRRWDWVYVPIEDAKKDYKIKVDDVQYDWWEFIKKINEVILETTNSEDKQLGYFFCKANDEMITEDQFVGKVLFYLWNDVFKDYGFDNKIFDKSVENGTTAKLSFKDFFGANGTESVKKFLENLGVEEELLIDPPVGKTKYKIDDDEPVIKAKLYYAVMEKYIKDNPEKTSDQIVKEWRKLKSPKGKALRAGLLCAQADYDKLSADAQGRREKMSLPNGENIYVWKWITEKDADDFILAIKENGWPYLIEKIN